jgi:hypothetical protein
MRAFWHGYSGTLEWIFVLRISKGVVDIGHVTCQLLKLGLCPRPTIAGAGKQTWKITKMENIVSFERTASQALGRSEDISRAGSVLHPTVFLSRHSEAIYGLGIGT